MKHLFYAILVLSLFSCSKDEPEKINTPPKAFEVTTKVEGTNVTLTWTEAVDSDGDAVNYAVVYKDTLAKGLTTRTFTIKDLPYETEISGTVVASDGKGGKTEQGFKVKTGAEPWDDRYVKIPDIKFEEYLVWKGIDDKVDGQLLKDKAKTVKDLYGFGKNITDLTGIEVFENLELIILDYMDFKELDFKHNRKLKTLSVTYNPNLKVLDISGCETLEVLNADGCAIEVLDISNNKKLNQIFLDNNKLSELDISKHNNLNTLHVDNNKLSSLNLNQNLRIENLYVNGNNIESLDLSKNLEIIELYCGDNKLQKLSLSTNNKLTTLICSGNPIESISLPLSIVRLDLGGTYLKKIDFKNYKDLERLAVPNLGLETIDLSQNLKLTNLDLSENRLSEINLSKNVNITGLFIYDNLLSTLDLCNNSKLNTLHCHNNKMGNIIIHKNVTPKTTWNKDATAIYKVCD